MNKFLSDFLRKPSSSLVQSVLSRSNIKIIKQFTFVESLELEKVGGEKRKEKVRIPGEFRSVGQQLWRWASRLIYLFLEISDKNFYNCIILIFLASQKSKCFHIGKTYKLSTCLTVYVKNYVSLLAIPFITMHYEERLWKP